MHCVEPQEEKYCSANCQSIEKYDHREASGLWSDANTWSCWRSHLHQPEFNSSRGRKYDLHFCYGSCRVSKETALNLDQSLFLPVQRCHGYASSMSLPEIQTIRLQPPRNRRTIARILPCPCLSGNCSDSDDEAQSGRLWGPSRRPSLERQRGTVPGIPIPEYVHRIIEYTHYLIPRVDRIYSASYYWGRMDRYKAERLLESKPEGSFLLRDSAQSEYLFSVSFRRFQRTLHARIEQGRNMFSFDILDESVFSASNVTDLIANYKDPSKCLFFEPQLSNPISRNFVFSLQELCRAKIASMTVYADISSLNLPGQLKSYVRELHYSVPIRTLLTTHE